MAITSGFYTSDSGDRQYTNEQFAHLVNNLIHDGIFLNRGNNFAVTQNQGLDGSVLVDTGYAWFNGRWVYNDAQLSIALPSNSITPGYNRYDAITIKVNNNDSVRAAEINVLKGNEGADTFPTIPSEENIYYHVIALVHRLGGQGETITAANIINLVGSEHYISNETGENVDYYANCPYVTSVVQVTDTDALLYRWESLFFDWFSDVQTNVSSLTDNGTSLAGSVASLQTNALMRVLSSSDYGATLPAAGTPGRVFFKKV